MVHVSNKFHSLTMRINVMHISSCILMELENTLSVFNIHYTRQTKTLSDTYKIGAIMVVLLGEKQN